MERTPPEIVYRNRLEELQQTTKNLSARLRWIAFARILLFLSMLAAAYYGLSLDGNYGLLILPALVLFVLSVSNYADTAYELRKSRELLALNTRELAALRLQFDDFPDGPGYSVPGHPFAQDLDLFGPRSFFQYINRTGLPGGAAKLAEWLASNDIREIPARQQAVRQLAPLVAWRQDFFVTATLSSGEIPLGQILEWLEGHTTWTPKYATALAGVFALGSLGVWLGYLTGMLSIWPPALLFLTGLTVSGIFFPKTTRLSNRSAQARDTFTQYYRLVGLVEAGDFKEGIPGQLSARLRSGDRPLSQVLKDFGNRLQLLEHRNNLLVGLLGNGFLLWDLWAARRTEQWIGQHKGSVRDWFQSLESLDAWCSLGTFAFNHPAFSYPKILKPRPTKGSLLLRARSLAHPLLPEGQRVPNDIEILQGQFFVITGANMAGKSTFLRSLSLAMVMAHCGLPVCAAEMQYSPLPLISSMRTEDSLSRNESYFYAELKRLRLLVEALDKQPHFVVLDEILKGTNSKDKARGSRLLLERLVGSGATGLIATHDLSLCEAAESLDSVQNFYFEAEIRGGELYFDYKLRPGICSNMNASFLLRKMKIVRE